MQYYIANISILKKQIVTQFILNRAALIRTHTFLTLSLSNFSTAISAMLPRTVMKSNIFHVSLK